MTALRSNTRDSLCSCCRSSGADKSLASETIVSSSHLEEVVHILKSHSLQPIAEGIGVCSVASTVDIETKA